MPKVSIIVPVYNAEKYLDRCLQSLHDQTLQDVEVIAINDGSTDRSLSILNNFVTKMENLRIINQENKGISFTRNLGISLAAGEYIGFLDSDDYIEDTMFEMLYTKASSQNLDLIICDYYEEDETKNYCKRITMPEVDKEKLYGHPELLNAINTSPWNKLYKREFILKYDIKFPEKVKYEDVFFVMQAIKYANTISSLSIPLLHYIIHKGSETKVIDQRVYDIFKILDLTNDLFKTEKEQLLFYEQLEYFNIRRITIYCLQQIYQKDNVFMEFINDAYQYLDTHYPSWRNNGIFKKNESLLKGVLKKHKFLTKLTVKIGRAIT